MIASLDFMLQVGLIPHGLKNYVGDGREVKLSNFDEFKGNECVFVVDWLKTKGLHKLCPVFEGV